MWEGREEIAAAVGLSARETRASQANASSLNAAAAEIAGVQAALGKSLAAAGAAARTRAPAELRAALDSAISDRLRLVGQRRSGWEQARSLATFQKDEIVADRTLELRIEMLDRKMDGLRHLLPATEQSGGARERASQASAACNAALGRLRDFEDDFVLLRELRQTFGKEQTRRAKEAQERCEAARVSAERWRALSTARASAGAWGATLSDQAADLRAQAAEQAERASNTFGARVGRFWSEWRVDQILRTAALSLLWIMATPYLIRVLAYHVLAPAAERRGAIALRLGLEEPDASPLSSAPSTPSVPLRLDPGEELLVRQGFVQSTSVAGHKATQWLLDWRHPLTSMAAGLWFLTRIRGDGEVAFVSALEDPIAELSVLILPAGSSCVLRPTSVAAVATSELAPLRITSHWRLGTLSAWLTFQFRYLVFHGPARLVLRGGRGVRVERAEKGRIFGQDQLVGFSADLSYSVTRAETFWPYFFGRESLFKDKVQAGTGILILEEAPFGVRGRPPVRRGLEGAMDAALKAVGL